MGNQIEKVYFDSELKITHGFEKKFNERNQILLKKELGKNRKLIDTKLYTYSNKKLASWQTIDRYNKIEDTYTIKVEKSTMTAMIESVGSNQQHALVETKYNNKGKIIEIHFFDCNILISKLFNEFNNLGQLIKSIYYDKMVNFSSHNYVLDKKGRIKEENN
ncbi:MAG: hypothetical protein IPO63_09210 [Bacteroidetes bacterium]|nr:hypothetical protein [Bacteroidota bacterium]